MENQNLPNQTTPEPAPPQAPTPGVRLNQSVPTEPQLPKRSKGEAIKNALSTVGVFLLAPIIAVLLTVFVFQSYEVDGPSMETTLQNQDRLIVYKLPKTIANITKRQYMPRRGEIIVFTRHAGENSLNSDDKQLIKRVIGMPGDHVVIKSGLVTIFNEDNPTGFNPDDGQSYSGSFSRTSGNIDITVDEGEVFVLGDNRENSLDSRVFGPINVKDISGELVLRIFPFNKFESY